jgi:tRNA1Val (adenine37-N6)-methyltransferase
MTNPRYIDLKKHSKGAGTFYFKQFKVEDGRSTMKVGTDAVLLGAVADTATAAYILEIGTGCGIIALILAQRSNARIDAIEIDEESANQAVDNVRESPWHGRINIIHKSIQDFVKQTDNSYDLIISNPPFFSGSLKSPEKKRNITRHDDLLNFDELINASSQLMSQGGSLWIILPVKESGDFIKIAANSGFFVHYFMKVISKKGNKYHRVILQLKKTQADKILEKTLAILNNDGSFTKEYMEVMTELYLDF